MIDDTITWPEKKQRLVEITIKLIAERGFDKTTTAAIAKESKVGEGTIYRHFKNKEALIQIAANYAAERIFGAIRRQDQEDDPLKDQYHHFCREFLQTGNTFPLDHKFLEQYLNSPTGVEFRLATLIEVTKNPDAKPLFYPLNRILLEAKREKTVKDLPIQLLIALTMGQLTFIVKHASQGFLELRADNINQIAACCWDAVAAQKQP